VGGVGGGGYGGGGGWWGGVVCGGGGGCGCVLGEGGCSSKTLRLEERQEVKGFSRMSRLILSLKKAVGFGTGKNNTIWDDSLG